MDFREVLVRGGQVQFRGSNFLREECGPSLGNISGSYCSQISIFPDVGGGGMPPWSPDNTAMSFPA